jgi:hypothetical protein
MAVVGNGQAPYVATAPELTNSATDSTWSLPLPAKIYARGDLLRTQSFTLAVKGDRLPMTKAVRHGSRRLIDGGYPFAASGW